MAGLAAAPLTGFARSRWGVPGCGMPVRRSSTPPPKAVTTTVEGATHARAPGLLLGVGLGGFLDGIVLHQILQWHHLLSSTDDHPVDTVAGLEVNTRADGLFHLGTWLAVLAGAALALRARQQHRLAPGWRFQMGLLLAGWGLFNVVEGVVDHHLLGLHHVRDDLGAPLSWDVGFLAAGVLLSLGGRALHRSGEPALAEARGAGPAT